MTKQLPGSFGLNRIYQMDCLDGSKLIKDGSVDLILTDLPYGTVGNIGNSENIKHGMKNKTQWDLAIDPKKVYEIANRILRKNGKMVLFSQEPYTSRLINEAIPNVPFSYRMVWEKDHFANSLIAKKAPVSYFEDILVFSKNECYEAAHPLRTKMLKYVETYGKEFVIELFSKEGRYTSDLSSRVHASYKFGFNNGMRFDLMDEKMFSFLGNHMNFDETYAELKSIDNEYKQKYRSVFNLWEGNKYKSNILSYKKDYDGFHPTQKPLLLLEDLIKTFSNEGNTVVDLTCGSGSTCVSAVRTNRNFIGFELEREYVEIANKRLDTETEAE